MKPYPIKFEPILKEKIWGGQKLKNLLNKKTEAAHVGESWEISGVEGNISVVSNGLYKGKTLNELIKEFGPDFMGFQNIRAYGDEFPLLIKFLDADNNLSVQVHPDDDMAKTHHNSFGKTEMWYVMESDINAEIVMGLKDSKTDASVLKDVNAHNVNEIFNFESVQKGDCYFIPAGKIHALGKGVMAAEIQQTSDVTYRIYDWDRVDDEGNGRELHIEQAIEATKTPKDAGKKSYNLEHKNNANLVDCDFFKTNIQNVSGIQIKDYTTTDSFVILMCVEGEAQIRMENHTEYVSKGETVLLPASTNQVLIKSSSAHFLEVFSKSSAKSEFKEAI
jgi:mannose-6-phosphate isomerase